MFTSVKCSLKHRRLCWERKHFFPVSWGTFLNSFHVAEIQPQYSTIKTLSLTFANFDLLGFSFLLWLCKIKPDKFHCFDIDSRRVSQPLTGWPNVFEMHPATHSTSLRFTASNCLFKSIFTNNFTTSKSQRSLQLDLLIQAVISFFLMQLLPSCGFFICVPRHDVVMERESDEDGTQDMKENNEETRWLCQICFLHPSLYVRQLNSIVGHFVLTLVLIRLLVHHSAFTPWQLLGFCAQKEREGETEWRFLKSKNYVSFYSHAWTNMRGD